MAINNKDVQAILDKHGGFDCAAVERDARQAMEDLDDLLDLTEREGDKAEIRKVMAIIFERAQGYLFQGAKNKNDVDAIADKWSVFDNRAEPVVPLLAQAHKGEALADAIQQAVVAVIETQSDTLRDLRKRNCPTKVLADIEARFENQWSCAPQDANRALDGAIKRARADMNPVLDR